MDYNNLLQNNASYSNNLQSPQSLLTEQISSNAPLNTSSPQSFQTEQFSLNALYNTSNYIDYSSTMNNDIVPTSYTQQQQSMFSFAGDESATAGTTQPLPCTPQYAPQYGGYSSYDISSRSHNIISNSSQSHSEVIKFEIPGFKIIIIPNSSPYSSLYANLDKIRYTKSISTSFYFSKCRYR